MIKKTKFDLQEYINEVFTTKNMFILLSIIAIVLFVFLYKEPKVNAKPISIEDELINRLTSLNISTTKNLIQIDKLSNETLINKAKSDCYSSQITRLYKKETVDINYCDNNYKSFLN